MTADNAPKQNIAAATSLDGLGHAPQQMMVAIAERELERALLEQSRSATGMSAQPSPSEHAAIQRAIHTICVEARQLDLKAEELVIGIKQAWSQLAHVRARQLGDRDGDVLREVVSSAIAVFFEGREPSTNERRD